MAPFRNEYLAINDAGREASKKIDTTIDKLLAEFAAPDNIDQLEVIALQAVDMFCCAYRLRYGAELHRRKVEERLQNAPVEP